MRRILVTSALPYANARYPHRASGRVHPDRHLGAVPEAARQPLHLHVRRRHARHGDHDPRPAGRPQRGSVDRRDAGGPRARLRRLRHRVRQLRQHAQRGEPRAVRRDSGSRSARPGWSKEQDVEQLYDPQAGTFLADRFVRGTCPKCKSPDQSGDNCSKCGHHYSPTELIDPRSTLSGATPEVRIVAAPVHRAREAARLSGRVDAIGRALAAGDRQLPEGPLSRRAAARLGHLAAGAVLRLRDSRQPRQLLVRLVRRADRLHGLARSSGAIARARSSTTGGDRPTARSTTSSARTSRTSTRCSGPAC